MEDEETGSQLSWLGSWGFSDERIEVPVSEHGFSERINPPFRCFSGAVDAAGLPVAGASRWQG